MSLVFFFLYLVNIKKISKKIGKLPHYQNNLDTVSIIQCLRNRSCVVKFEFKNISSTIEILLKIISNIISW